MRFFELSWSLSSESESCLSDSELESESESGSLESVVERLGEDGAGLTVDV